MLKAAVRSLACLPLFCAHLWAQGLDVMFVLETSPGTEQQIGLIRPRDLKEGDRAGVIGYTRSVQMLQSLTEDHEALATALQRAGMRITVGPYSGRSPAAGRGSLAGGQVVQGEPVDLSGALRQALRELGDRGSEVRKRVVIVLDASEDLRPEKAAAAGHTFRRADVDLLFLHVTTYALSSTVLPVVRRVKVPVIILNLSPGAAIDYASFNAMSDRGKMTGEWLAWCQAFPGPKSPMYSGVATSRFSRLLACLRTIRRRGTKSTSG